MVSRDKECREGNQGSLLTLQSRAEVAFQGSGPNSFIFYTVLSRAVAPGHMVLLEFNLM